MSTTAVVVYRALLRLYPRGFRDEYGADMALLLADQLRDERAGRVWVRAVIDLAVTVPTRHLEAHMNRPPSPLIPLLFAGVGFAGLCVAAIGGSHPETIAVGLSIAVVAVGLAAVAWRGIRPVTTQQVTARWWKFLAGGLGVLATVIVATTATGEVDDRMWWPTMITVGCALALLGGGLLLGLAHGRARRLRNATR
jgi:hypothetical protein